MLETPSTQLLIFLTKLLLTSSPRGTGIQPTGTPPGPPLTRLLRELRLSSLRAPLLLVNWIVKLLLNKQNYQQLKPMSLSLLLRSSDSLEKSLSKRHSLPRNKRHSTLDNKRIRTLSMPVMPLWLFLLGSALSQLKLRLFKYNRLI